jgi:signal transduction histidine kinase
MEQKLWAKTFHDHPDAKGTGLFITKNQETMGGIIYAESKVDQGTKFIIYFNVNNSLI